MMLTACAPGCTGSQHCMLTCAWLQHADTILLLHRWLARHVDSHFMICRQTV